MAAVGASFVTDVLQKSGRLEKEDLQTSVGKLSQKADDVKTQVYTLILKQYTDFMQSYNLTMEMNSKVQELSTEMNHLSEKIKGDIETQLQKANNMYTDLSEQLNETNLIINVLTKMCQIHDLMLELSVLKIRKDYCKISEVLERVKCLLEDLPKSGTETKIFRILRAEYLTEQSEFLHTLNGLWDKCISWKTTTTPSWDNIDGHLKTKLTISTSDTTEIKLALQTLQSLKLLDEKLSRFGKKFLQFIIRPIVIFPRLKPVQSQNVETCVFSFSKDLSKSSKMGISTMLDRIGQTFEHLSKAFVNRTFPDANDGQEEQSLAGMLGEIIWKQLTEIIIKDCLEKCVPTTSSQLEKYEDTITTIAKFEMTLIATGFLAEGTETLQTYCKNVTTHFSNKKCQDLLFTAREMLKSNVSFHNSKLVSIPDKNKPVSPLVDISGGNKDGGRKENERSPGTPTENKLSENMFHFPTCRVSECIPEFFNLVYGTLVEATESNKPGDVRLFYTARNMIELYRVVVPTYYEEDLRELPQMSALHYNNCMFLTHHLLTLGHQFRSKLPEPLNRGAATFVDMVSPMRNLGEKCFEDQLRKQSHILLDLLDSGGGLLDLKVTLMEKSIRQVCYQVLKLSRVWKDILPENIYKSALGTLLNISLNRFLEDILKLEDISSDDSHSLHNLMGIFVDKCPEAIQIPAEEMPETVKVWRKFLELRCIIDSSLQNIENRWSEGKGPLAQEFSCNEIRGLIRALFQNTDRRASVLGKIRPS
ncbi:centromere/kinetochore protein zw10 homolog [Dendronephthya gigantea]|uniref:centromere/kinetochore protein zw10 homolog n=1 Tax=Dendronephthya gigantea TaxID=151771 RepID=UPI00106D109E|nr:centromere/kinetochore protein zw10 homolog [Dendronephthya gigantea]